MIAEAFARVLVAAKTKETRVAQLAFIGPFRESDFQSVPKRRLMDIDLHAILSTVLHLGAAFLFALPIAWNRERETALMGIRTFPMVAMASCGFLQMASTAFDNDPEAQARVLQGLMTGIGFLGGGAILKDGDQVKGTATAVSIWTTGALGAAVALERFELAILLAIVNYTVLRGLGAVKSRMKNKSVPDRS